MAHAAVKRRFVAAALAAGVLLLSSAAHAGAPVVVAGPAAATTGYATPVVLISQGQEVTFVNLEVFVGHDVVSADPHPTGDAPWCSRYQGGCPLFASEEINASAAPVEGTASLLPGIYAFYCNPHPWMTGSIVVLAE